MSKWNEVKIKDLSISLDGEDLHAYTGYDEDGSIYTSIPIKDVLKVIDEYRALNNLNLNS